MPIEVVRRPNEPLASLLRRFLRRVQGSGIRLEVKRLRFRKSRVSRDARRSRALYRGKIQHEIERARKYGKWDPTLLPKIKQKLKYEGEI